MSRKEDLRRAAILEELARKQRAIIENCKDDLWKVTDDAINKIIEEENAE